MLYLKHGGKNIDLPVAIVADRSRNTVSEIRVYHSAWQLTGKHAIKQPLKNPAMHPGKPLIIEKYMIRFAKSDKAGILELFEEKGYVREPSGSSYKHSGPAGRKEFYDQPLMKAAFTQALQPLKGPTSLWNTSVTNGERRNSHPRQAWQFMNWARPKSCSR